VHDAFYVRVMPCAKEQRRINFKHRPKKKEKENRKVKVNVRELDYQKIYIPPQGTEIWGETNMSGWAGVRMGVIS